LKSQLQSTYEEKKKSDENTSRKSETLHREKIEIESICNDYKEEHEDCTTSRLKKLNARKNKKIKTKRASISLIRKMIDNVN
jgi:hypothetical protein